MHSPYSGWFLCGATLLLAACGQPVPADKADYVGFWAGQSIYLQIQQDGHVSYKRKSGSSTTKIEGPIKRFDGNDFEVGIGPVSTRFVVSEPPRQVADGWTMTVDGITLVRTRP